MKAFLAALVATVVIFVAVQAVFAWLQPATSSAVAKSVPQAVRLDPEDLPSPTGELRRLPQPAE